MWGWQTENGGKHLNENRNTYVAHEKSSEKKNIGIMITTSTQVSTNSNDKMMMHRAKTYWHVLLDKK